MAGKQTWATGAAVQAARITEPSMWLERKPGLLVQQYSLLAPLSMAWGYEANPGYWAKG